MIDEKFVLKTSLTVPECRAALSRLIVDQTDFLLGPLGGRVRTWPVVPSDQRLGRIKDDSFWLLHRDELGFSLHSQLVRGRLEKRHYGTEIIISLGYSSEFNLAPRFILGIFAVFLVVAVSRNVLLQWDFRIETSTYIAAIILLIVLVTVGNFFIFKRNIPNGGGPPPFERTERDTRYPLPAIVQTLMVLLEADLIE